MEKILIIGPLPPPYHGQSIATEILLNSRISQHFKIDCIDTSRRLSDKSGKFEFRRALKVLSYIGILFLKLIKEKPDLIYITISQSILGYTKESIFIVLTKIFRKKCVVHLHGGYFGRLYENSSVPFKWLIKHTIKKVDAAVVLTESLRYIFKGLIDNDRIKVIPNCVGKEFVPHPDEIHQKFEQMGKDIQQRSFKVLYLSNLIKSKGYFDLLHSALIIKEKKLPLKFLFAGAWADKKDMTEVEKFIEKHDLGNEARFVGVVRGEEKKRLLLESEVFVLPTCHEEGLPMSILEAMAAGLPIITTNYQGISELIVEGVNGFFVKPKRPGEIAKRIEKLFYDRELRLKMAQENVNKALNNFREKQFEDNFLQLFNEVLGKNNQ